MKQRLKNNPEPVFADETGAIVTAYLQTLISRADNNVTAAAEKSSTETVDFGGFGTEHASFLLKRRK